MDEHPIEVACLIMDGTIPTVRNRGHNVTLGKHIAKNEAGVLSGSINKCQTSTWCSERALHILRLLISSEYIKSPTLARSKGVKSAEDQIKHVKRFFMVSM